MESPIITIDSKQAGRSYPIPELGVSIELLPHTNKHKVRLRVSRISRVEVKKKTPDLTQSPEND